MNLGIMKVASTLNN